MDKSDFLISNMRRQVHLENDMKRLEGQIMEWQAAVRGKRAELERLREIHAEVANGGPIPTVQEFASEADDVAGTGV